MGKKINKRILLDDLWRGFIVILSSVIYSLGVIWFLEPVQLLAGGVSGISQLLNRLCSSLGINISVGVIVFILNIPILLVGFKNVSTRFAVFTILSIAVQSLLLTNKVASYISSFEILDITRDALGKIDSGSYFAFSIIGGLVTGFGGALALKYGTSTGGIDVLAQAMTFKNGLSFAMITLVINVIIAFLGGIQEGEPSIVVYTVIKMLIASYVVDKVHTSYNYLDIQIITTAGDEISEALIAEVGRGITIIHGEGAYTHEGKDVLNTVISSYEVNKVQSICRKYDSHAFIIISPVKRVMGNFKRKTIA